MTDDEINTAIAVACRADDRWVIMKRGLYYRPEAHGYTSNISEAWIVSEEIAEKHITHFPCDEPVTKRRAPIPDYAKDLNAMNNAEELCIRSLSADIKYTDMLRLITSKATTIYTPTRAMVCAKAHQRAEALVALMQRRE